MAQITEIIMTAYERLQKLITDGDIYTKSQLDEKLDEVESKFGTEVADALQDKIDDGSLGALTIGDKSISEEKVMNNSLSSYVLKGNKGKILQKNALVVTLGATITVTSKGNISIFYDNTEEYITSTVDLTINGAITAQYCLYLNLENKQIEIALMSTLTMPCIILATIYNNISGDKNSQVALYGNDEAIKVYKGDVQVFDKVDSYLKGAISPVRKINILIDRTAKTLDVAFASFDRTTVFVNGISYKDITTKESLTYTVDALPFNLLYNIKTNKLFFRYGDISISENMGSNVIFLCSFFTDGTIVDIASGSVHNILVNGVDYFPTGSVDNTEVKSSSPLWNNPDYVFGIDKTIANIPLEQTGSRVIKGMVSTVCSPNSRWNRSYDDGKGGHGFETFAKDFSYRYTVLLDHREADDLPVCSIQVFQRSRGVPIKQFGWTRIGTDDYSKTSYGYVGGWQFRDSFAYANCPTRYRKRPLPTSLPTNNKSDIPLDDCPIIACDLNGDLKQWDYETKTWYKLITEKELSQTEMINNKLIGVEHALIMLPNKLRNLSKVENGKVYQVKKVGLRVLNGTENWAILKNESGEIATMYHCGVIAMEQYVGGNSATNMVSDKGICKYVTREDALGEDALGNEDIIIMGRDATSYGFRMLVRNTLATDVATLKTYLASNNIKVYYQLANEVTTEIIV